MKDSTNAISDSCPIREVFTAPGLTAYGGASLLVDFLRRHLNLRDCFRRLPLQKASWATYRLDQELESLVGAYALGIPRIGRMDEIVHDPLLCRKLGVAKLPQKSTLYRALERFDSAERVATLATVNARVLERLLGGQEQAILDIDTTVETVYGKQERSCVGYNPRYHGRSSYQPLLAFEGQSQAVVHVTLRSGRSPAADEKISFYRQAKSQLPPGCHLRFLRADKGFTSEDLCAALEEDNVGYTLKLRMTKGLRARIERGVLWRRLPGADSNIVLEAGCVKFKAVDWSKYRRVALIRTKPLDDPQEALFADYLWDYEAIVTNLNWDPEDVWHFYNHRCTCENSIKELKQGLRIDAIAKADFWPNAADLWLKTIAYNASLGFKRLAPAPYDSYTAQRLRRALFQVPAQLIRHARQWWLKLPEHWPHQEAWQALRLALNSG